MLNAFDPYTMSLRVERCQLHSFRFAAVNQHKARRHVAARFVGEPEPSNPDCLTILECFKHSISNFSLKLR